MLLQQAHITTCLMPALAPSQFRKWKHTVQGHSYQHLASLTRLWQTLLFLYDEGACRVCKLYTPAQILTADVAGIENAKCRAGWPSSKMFTLTHSSSL